jgi:hypothetical protein
MVWAVWPNVAEVTSQVPFCDTPLLLYWKPVSSARWLQAARRRRSSAGRLLCWQTCSGGGAATGGGLERQAAAAAEYDVRLKREDAQTQLQFYQTVSFELT